MADEPSIASFSKLSDVAASLVRDVGKNLPMLVALAFASLGALSWTSIADVRITALLIGVPVFVAVYYLGILWQSYRPNRQQRYFLKRLGEDEKSVLRMFLEQDRRTMHMNIFYAPTASLIAKGILAHSTATFSAFDAPMVIHAYTYEQLCERPELIGMKKEDIGKEEIDESDCPWMSRP